MRSGKDDAANPTIGWIDSTVPGTIVSFLYLAKANEEVLPVAVPQVNQ